MRFFFLSVYIAKDTCTIEHQFTHRQLIVNSDQSNSWCIKTFTLCKYDLTEPMHLLLSIKSDKERLHWKNTIKKKVHDFWHIKNIQEAETKSPSVYMKAQGNSARSPVHTQFGYIVRVPPLPPGRPLSRLICCQIPIGYRYIELG